MPSGRLAVSPAMVVREVATRPECWSGEVEAPDCGKWRGGGAGATF
jgi:hypothetical protein